MAKKSGVVNATNRIGGIAGKGAYTYNEIGSGEKCMSHARGKLTSDKGRMSSEHGTNGQSKDNNMNQNAKGAVGSYCRTFVKGIPGEAHVRREGHVTAQGKEKD